MGVRWDTNNHHLWAQCFTGCAATSVTCYTCGQPGHVATDCTHTANPFVPPGKQPHLPVTSPTPLLANPKSAVSSTLVDTRTKHHQACTNTDTNVLPATAITQRQHVPARAPINKHKLNMPLQPEVFAMSLRNHPDPTFVESLLWLLRHGFNLGYTDARYFCLSSNLKSALEDKVIVQLGLDLECERGHMAGPYKEPHLPTLQCSGVGVVPKKNGSWRLIMHLSASRGFSINDGIDPEEYHLQYKKIDDAIAFVKQAGQGCYMVKMDLKHAFRLCPVRREDWDLSGVYWGGQYYVDK